LSALPLCGVLRLSFIIQHVMHDRLSFYYPRDSLLHRLNPLTKLALVFGLILVWFISPFYWTSHLSILVLIVPLVFLGKVTRKYIQAAIRIILPATTFLFIMQALFQPLEGKELFRIWFLHPTLESALFAFRNAARVFAIASSFTILLLTTHPRDLMTDLTRRGLPPQFAYVIISTLQILPQMQAKAQTILAAQRSRGLETQGKFLRRVASLGPLVGPLVFGSLVEVEERAIAIEARGFTSTRVKTSLHDIPDTKLDKALRWIFMVLVIISIVLRVWLS
jgi:energy-coupling factor transport system permease protein